MTPLIMYIDLASTFSSSIPQFYFKTTNFGDMTPFINKVHLRLNEESLSKLKR
ncbi:hypothetical protein HX004_14615 [Myroides sp. 1354]|uniref:hypothetical protein n=1 Tax=unclassified Myroides TaxID=2642485 RepID=UPI0025771C93|nr:MULTISPECIES: hypothetical protein [unclassified Myroides]MDM1046060.1 hypothetical protein [Myroides sp. R163-1]MDM1056996.1 hypothetical protein [Myroides sp. 1354]MDM1070191.1 hypothetical protein [Myroides sp. 1372]